MSTHGLGGKKPVRVLVVDDYAPLADHLAHVLCSAGYETRAVYSGAEALLAAEQASPDALVADIMMPGMNGVELAGAFGEQFPACRPILMTATQLLPELFIHGLRIRVLQKPFEIEALFDFLTTCAPER